MAPLGEVPLRPGPRMLFPRDMGAVVADDVTALLLELGQACNETGLAVQDAHAQLAHAAEAVWRRSSTPEGGGVVAWVTTEWFEACRDHAERLTALYARVTAEYATTAVEIASRVADGGPATTVTSDVALPSDVLSLVQIHVPLLQIPERAVSARWRRRLRRENAGLADDHSRLVAAMASVESPPTAFDDPNGVAERQTGELLEAEFCAALHTYATSCVYALAIMTTPD